MISQVHLNSVPFNACLHVGSLVSAVVDEADVADVHRSKMKLTVMLIFLSIFFITGMPSKLSASRCHLCTQSFSLEEAGIYV